jgi:TolA-binding protein
MMHMRKILSLGSLSTLALLAGLGAATAQTAQVIMAPGIVVVVNPPGVAPAAAPMPVMADPFAMIRQMDAQMDQMNQQMSQMIQAAQRNPQQTVPNGAAGVFVTTISDGPNTCTQRIVYPGNGAPPKIEVSETGSACAAMHWNTPGGPTPSALPDTTQPARPALPPTIQVRNTGKPASVMLADNSG